MNNLNVFRLERNKACKVGYILKNNKQFIYSNDYLLAADAIPLSASLPLKKTPYTQDEFRPYFEGLLAEGSARAQLTGELKIKEDDYLSLLEECGKECIGDVVVTKEDAPSINCDYEALTKEDFASIFSDEPHIFEQNAASRLSLAGTQSKTGLARFRDEITDDSWFKPIDFAATTHILKTSNIRNIPENEFLCMKAAKACGLDVAEVGLIDLKTPVLSVERFDRKIHCIAGERPIVYRVHQEDFAQAFGVMPQSKYVELEGGSIASISRFLRMYSIQPAKDIELFSKMLCFNYVVGNCDAHLKNYSILITETKNGGYKIRLSPAYDFVCTTVFPRFSRDMAMRFAGVQSIDDVVPQTFIHLAEEIGISVNSLKSIALTISENVISEILNAGKGKYGNVFESTPYIADDIEEDIVPRLQVMKEFCFL